MRNSSLSQNEARRAYGNTERSRETHDCKMEKFNIDIRENSAMRNRSVVLAALTGLLSAAGVLGGVSGIPKMSLRHAFHGAHAEKLLILRAVAGGAAVAYTTWQALVFERLVYDIELNRELWEIENHLTGEIKEMVEIYKAQGLSEEDALIVTRVFAKQKMGFANLMMVEELGYSRLEPPGRWEAVVDAAVPASIGYTLGWTLPLLPLTVRGLDASQGEKLGCCVLIVGSALVSVAQSEVFYGGYASVGKTLKVVLYNLLAVGVAFGVSRVGSSFFRGTS